jgi:signal transduction histidine kinase/DNA-binding response OmpR family regulator
MPILFFYFLTFSLFVNPFTSSAQEFLFSPVEGREQLNEEKIRNFIELSDNRIGVFTEGMLNLYNGASFKKIPIYDESSISLDSYKGFHHSYQENNRIWFKYADRLSLIDLDTEKCESNPSDVLKKLGFDEKAVDFFVDEKKDIWIVTKSGKLKCYSQSSKKVTSFCGKDILRHNDRLHDLVSHKSNLYLIYKSGFMACLDRKTAVKKYEISIIRDNGSFSEWAHATAVDHFIYIVRAGIGKGQLIRFDTVSQKALVLLQTDFNWLNTFSADKNGNFVISCREGFWSFNASSSKGTFHSEIPLKDSHSLKTEISTVLFDRQGGLWAGTLNKGIYYYHPSRSKFNCYEKKYFKTSDQNELQINSFEETSENKILVGTNKALFEASFPVDGSKTFNPLLQNLSCNALFKDSKKQIWIATSNGLYTAQQNGLIQIHTSAIVNTIYETKDGEIYMGTNNGVFKWNKSFENFELLPIKAKLTKVLQIAQWQDYLTGIASEGFFIIKLNTQQAVTSSIKIKKKLPFYNEKKHRYTCILTDSDGDLWLGTYNGLLLWNSKKQKVYHITTEDGIINNSVKAIVFDKKKNVYWVTTSRGVSCITKKYHTSESSFHIKNYDTYNGVLEYPFAERALFVSQNQGLFLGGIDGMNNLEIAHSTDKNYMLRPLLVNLKLTGKEVFNDDVYDGKTILSKAIAVTDTIDLNYNQNFFSLGFTGLNYVNPGHTYFRYKLEGFDDHWRNEKAATLGEANYTSIGAGTYTFRLQASTDGIQWSGPEKKLLIVIRPPIWKSIPAQIFYAVVTVLLLLLLNRTARRRSAIMQKRRQEMAVEKAKSEFMVNMSHELRTPLTLIITPLKALLSKVEDQSLKKELLRISSSSDLLLDTVNQLLDFKKIDTAEEELHCSFYDNITFLNELCTACLPMAQDREVSLSWEIDSQSAVLYLDRAKITRIVLNLLSNAIKFTNSQGNVKLTAALIDDASQLVITVTDTGQGIAEEDIENIFNRFYQTGIHTSTGSGIGLYLVKYYAEMHGGCASVASSPGKGSTFQVKLAVQKRAFQQPQTSAETNEKRNLLIAEDHLLFRNYLEEELKVYYNIITAKNGSEAFEKAVLNTPELIITDLMMPEMTGSELCHSLRNNIATSHIPIIMLTGRASDEARFQGYHSGADAYLIKPFEIKLLLLRIEKLLELNEARRMRFLKENKVEPDQLAQNPLDKELLEHAFQCVASNLSNPDYSVEKFSEDMNMDRTGLYRKLMALTALSPTNFIRTIRLKKAAELLLDKKLTIADVSDQVGFNSISYFTKCFHEAFGRTPSQSREEKASLSNDRQS